MASTSSIVLTSSVTLVAGIVLFVLSQLLLKLVIEPVIEQRKAIGETIYAMLQYAWAFANPAEQVSAGTDAASDALRNCASRLITTTNAVRPYWPARWLGAPRLQDVGEVASTLIGLSNGVYKSGGADPQQGSHNVESARRIRRLLGVRSMTLGGA
jgi:hypothetical protein